MSAIYERPQSGLLVLVVAHRARVDAKRRQDRPPRNEPLLELGVLLGFAVELAGSIAGRRSASSCRDRAGSADEPGPFASSPAQGSAG
jgi:hypothetical protein